MNFNKERPWELYCGCYIIQSDSCGLSELLFFNLAEKNSKTQLTLLFSMIHLPNLKVHFYGEQIGLFFRLLLPNESPFAHKEGLRIEYYLESIQDLSLRVLKIMYRTRAIITRSLYIFYPIFHCGLYCRAVSVTDNLCTKNGNSSFLSLKSSV